MGIFALEEGLFGEVTVQCYAVLLFWGKMNGPTPFSKQEGTFHGVPNQLCLRQRMPGKKGASGRDTTTSTATGTELHVQQN